MNPTRPSDLAACAASLELITHRVAGACRAVVADQRNGGLDVSPFATLAQEAERLALELIHVQIGLQGKPIPPDVQH